MKHIILLFIVVIILIVLQFRNYSSFSEPSLKILVSTCKNYREKSIPPLLDQLRASNVPDDSILIVSGGEDVDDSSDPILKKTRYQFWEYTGLIFVAENPDKSPVVYFMIHDTVKIEPHFWEAITQEYKKFIKTKQKGARLLENNGWSSMSMGFYTPELIEEYKEFLVELKDYKSDEDSLAKSKQKGYGLEDHMIKKFDVMFKGSQVTITNDEHKCINYIPELGFTKIQSNCQGNPIVLTYDL